MHRCFSADSKLDCVWRQEESEERAAALSRALAEGEAKLGSALETGRSEASAAADVRA